MPRIFAFGEGRTDQIVFEVLWEHSSASSAEGFQQFISVRGKDNFRSKIAETVRSELVPNREVRVLVFRDLDSGEDPSNIMQSFRDLVWELLDEWGLQPGLQALNSHPNVYVCTQPPSERTPGLRLVLHIADLDAVPDLPVQLLNHTTDAYLLAIGLTEPVLNRFANRIGSTPQSLSRLITNALPSAMTQENIVFDQDKDYLAAYLCAVRFWVVHRTEEQARLARIILKRALKYGQEDVRTVFRSWIAAIEEVSR
ncbi:hypothetical protein D6833_02910 [Candidatus Parcubacteria bacterium]|nr:MAG: hypothetical protein D6833_02910 [Candidatus Parcubacteria bacterium]